MEGISSGLVLCSRLDAMPPCILQRPKKRSDYLVLKAVIFEQYHGFAMVSDRCE